VRKKLIVIAFALLTGLVGLGVFHQYAPRHTPRGQPPLAAIDPASFHSLRDAFNAAQESTRILLLFSPT
jgi:hypothetical protein